MKRGSALPALLLAVGILAPSPELPGSRLHAQQVDPELPVEETGVELGDAAPEVTPGGAFLRSLAVPGWGHIATEAYTRGGFYVAAQTGSLWMLWQTLARRAEAEAFARAERRVVTRRLRQSGEAIPDSVLQRQVDEDPAVVARGELVESRDQQVEDWAALSIFLVLLGATDAYVAAHLADYPEPLSLDVIPFGDGSVQLGISVPIGGRPGRR